MLVHPWDAAQSDDEWKTWLAAGRDFGTLVATGSWDQTARVWDVQTGKLLHTLKGHKGGVAGLAVMTLVVLASWMAVSGTASAWTPPDCKITSCSR